MVSHHWKSTSQYPYLLELLGNRTHRFATSFPYQVESIYGALDLFGNVWRHEAPCALGSTKTSPPVPTVNLGVAQWRPVYSGGVLKTSIVSTWAPLIPTGRLMTPHDAKKVQGAMYLLNLMWVSEAPKYVQ